MKLSLSTSDSQNKKGMNIEMGMSYWVEHSLKVSISECCKPDFVHHAPKRLAVRSFIYLAEAKFPPK